MPLKLEVIAQILKYKKFLIPCSLNILGDFLSLLNFALKKLPKIFYSNIDILLVHFLHLLND